MSIFQIKNITAILTLYEEYKIKNNKEHLISIIPKSISDIDSLELAYTDNAELRNSILSGQSVTLYYNKKLFECSSKYIKAILFHEFTHIDDAYDNV